MTVQAQKYTPKDLRDSLERRRRNAPRQPSSDPIRLNSTHIQILQRIHLFGGFSTIDLIHEHLLQEGMFKMKSTTYTSKLLSQMFHDLGLVDKPRAQFAVENPYGSTKMNHVAPLIYQISEKGEETLKGSGFWNDYAPKAHGWYKHQMMTACLYQIFNLSARKAGIGFTPQHELKPKEKFIQVDSVKVFPDAVFVLHLHKPFLFFFEMDRATERGKGSKRKTWGKSIEFYKAIFDKKLYRNNYELPVDFLPFLATITVDANMEKKILEHIKDQYPDGFARMLVHTTRAFGPLVTDFLPPKYFNILAENWNRLGYAPAQFVK